MKRLILLSTLIAANYFYAQSEMKIEGTCQGQFRGTDISFSYYSAFDGCQTKSLASVVFTSEQLPSLQGSRVLGNGHDAYSFKTRQHGKLKTAYWLVFPDSTGNTEGVFRFRDTNGSLKSVVLQCSVNDYEYSECSDT